MVVSSEPKKLGTETAGGLGRVLGWCLLLLGRPKAWKNHGVVMADRHVVKACTLCWCWHQSSWFFLSVNQIYPNFKFLIHAPTSCCVFMVFFLCSPCWTPSDMVAIGLPWSRTKPPKLLSLWTPWPRHELELYVANGGEVWGPYKWPNL